MAGLQEKVNALELKCKTSEDVNTALKQRCHLLEEEAEKRACADQQSKPENIMQTRHRSNQLPAVEDTICARLRLFLHIREQQEKAVRTNAAKFERLEAKYAQLAAQIAKVSGTLRRRDVNANVGEWLVDVCTFSTWIEYDVRFLFCFLLVLGLVVVFFFAFIFPFVW